MFFAVVNNFNFYSGNSLLKQILFLINPYCDLNNLTNEKNIYGIFNFKLFGIIIITKRLEMVSLKNKLLNKFEIKDNTY